MQGLEIQDVNKSWCFPTFPVQLWTSEIQSGRFEGVGLIS